MFLKGYPLEAKTAPKKSRYVTFSECPKKLAQYIPYNIKVTKPKGSCYCHAGTVNGWECTPDIAPK